MIPTHEKRRISLIVLPVWIAYLLHIRRDQLQSLEHRFKGARIVDHLGRGVFITPGYCQDSVEQELAALTTVCLPLVFEIQDDAFRVTADGQSRKLINIAHQHECYVEIKAITESRTSQIPTTAVQDHVSNSLTATAIGIRLEDLSEQKVKMFRGKELRSLPVCDSG